MNLKFVKMLRQTTNAPIALCRDAAQFANESPDQALAYINQHWQAPKSKPVDAGQMFTYVHQGRIAAIVDLRCVTDFVAQTNQFQTLGREMALQVAANSEGSDILQQSYIRDQHRTIQELIDEVSRQLDETILVKRTLRWSLDDNVE